MPAHVCYCLQRQSVVYLVHPTTSQLKDWLGLFASAFALKFLEVAHMIFMQCMIDVFFIDWERSRGVVNTSADSGKTKEVCFKHLVLAS